jgi:hypothetical protein
LQGICCAHGSEDGFAGWPGATHRWHKSGYTNSKLML